MQDAEKTVGGMLDKQKTVCIGSVDENGFPNIKAMLKPRERDGIRSVYFTTNTSSRRVAQFQKNPKACLYVYDNRFFRGAMLIGTMKVLLEQEWKDRIWRIGDEMYYPKGKTDPDYCVLAFSAERGRFYSNFSSEDFNIP